ncbi:MAG TPA: hopanoid-associated sugar epimerase, partial [Magnetospirillum sp.]|nr:hopanoid-associated sugar epimerase [Magnetospirillum sp.]
MDKVLVTGASGFVGSRVVRALLARGYGVRALVRPNSPRRNLDGLDVDVAPGDLNDAASLSAALDGCHALVHAAADYRLWAPDPKPMLRTNVEGTRALMLAALESGLRRIVYTSSVATLGIDSDGPADEDTPSSLEQMVGPYKRSKYLAEEVVRGLVAEHGLPAVIVNPSTPIGPGDIRPTPTGRIVIEAAMGRMPAHVDTGLNLVHVDDCARGHVLALERGQIGQRYILGGDDTSLAALLTEIAKHRGRKPPRIALPLAAVVPVALVAEGWGRLTGREPFVTLDGLRMARHRMYFTSTKAERELGYAHRPARLAVADAL